MDERTKAKVEELLHRADELRVAANDFNDQGLHVLADEKMRELVQLVEAYDDTTNRRRARVFILFEVTS